jgi:hypothetical protein
MVFGIIATAIEAKIGLYKLLVIGSSFHFTFTVIYILPAYKSGHTQSTNWFISTITIEILLSIFAVLFGFGSAVLWTC